MVTAADIAKYESFYAGTRYYAGPEQPFGAPATTGAVTPAGEEIPVPISGISKITKEGEVIPIGAGVTEVMTEWGPVSFTPEAYESEKARYAAAGLPVPRPWGRGEVTVLTSGQEPARRGAYEAAAEGTFYNPYTRRYEQRQEIRRQERPELILPPYPTGQVTAEVARGTVPLMFRTRAGPFEIAEEIPVEMETRELEAGEYAFTGREPTIFTETISGVARFFGVGEEPLPDFIGEGPSYTTTGRAEYVLLPRPQYGQQTLIGAGFEEMEKLPRMEFFGAAETAAGFGLGVLTAPVEIASIPAQLLGFRTELKTREALSVEFKGGFTAGTYVGMELTALGAQKAFSWLKTKVRPKAYEIELPIGLTQKRRTYARKVPAAFDFEKEISVSKIRLVSDKKPTLFIPDEFEFKFLKAEARIPVEFDDVWTIKGSAEYGRGFWSADKKISFKGIDKLIKQERILLIEESEAARHALKMEGAYGGIIPEWGEIFLSGEKRQTTLRHEIIHWLQPEWAEADVLTAELAGRGIPKTKEILWPAAFKAREEIFIADLSGVYPDINIPKIDFTKLTITPKIGKSTVLYDLAKGYKTQKTVTAVSVVADAELALPTFTFMGTEIAPTVTPRWPAFIEAGERTQFIVAPPKFTTEKLGTGVLGTTTIRIQRLTQLGAQRQVKVQALSLARRPKRKFDQRLGIESVSKKAQLFSFSTKLAQQQKQSMRLETRTALRQRKRVSKIQITGAPRPFRMLIPRLPPYRPKKKKISLTIKPLRVGRRKKKKRKGKRRRRDVLPLADPLSVTITKARAALRGKRIIAYHPRGAKAWKAFRTTGGLRIPTVEPKKRKKKKKGKKRKRRKRSNRWF